MIAATDEILWIAYHASRSIDDRNRLIERYMPVVEYHAQRFSAKTPECVETDDLVSYGVFGLIEAIDAFDPARGVRFETYCVQRIRGAMIDELRKLDWVPRLERKRRAPEEITTVTSLDKTLHQFEETGSLLAQLDVLTDRKAVKPQRTTQRCDLLRLVTKGLGRDERLIVVLYYRADLTMKEIGELLGLSESRVSQVHSALLPRIRKRLEGREEEFAI